MKARNSLFASKGGARPATYDPPGVDDDRFAERRVITLRRKVRRNAGGGAEAAAPRPIDAIPVPRLGVDETPPDGLHVKKFTLRLDSHRHRRFHLVTQLDKISGQALLTRLLDRYLEQRLGPGSLR